ncbi:MAG: hypothetical protein V1647_00690 [Pseudomonadota bacterium]
MKKLFFLIAVSFISFASIYADDGWRYFEKIYLQKDGTICSPRVNAYYKADGSLGSYSKDEGRNMCETGYDNSKLIVGVIRLMSTYQPDTDFGTNGLFVFKLNGKPVKAYTGWIKFVPKTDGSLTIETTIYDGGDEYTHSKSVYIRVTSKGELNTDFNRKGYFAPDLWNTFKFYTNKYIYVESWVNPGMEKPYLILSRRGIDDFKKDDSYKNIYIGSPFAMYEYVGKPNLDNVYILIKDSDIGDTYLYTHLTIISIDEKGSRKELNASTDIPKGCTEINQSVLENGNIKISFYKDPTLILLKEVIYDQQLNKVEEEKIIE